MTNPPNDPAQLLAEDASRPDRQHDAAVGQRCPGVGSAGNARPGPLAADVRWRRRSDYAEMQQELLEADDGILVGDAGVRRHPAMQAAAPIAQDEDRRFAGEAWRNDPRFDAVKRGYLAYSSFLQDAVESAQVDEKTKEQMRFGVRQFIDAMSPANFLATNPEAIQLAVETGGKSLIEGIGPASSRTWRRAACRITDESAFEVGKNVAVTPGAVIYENELIQVIQYTPTTDEVHERPLVLIPPCINKFYILDLQPENSLVRYAVEQGHTVFLVSWRNVDAGASGT